MVLFFGTKKAGAHGELGFNVKRYGGDGENGANDRFGQVQAPG